MIGYLAAFLTTISFLPQVIQIVKTKDTKSISLLMYLMFIGGISLWLIYGFSIGDIPVIVANGTTLCLAFIVLIYKLKYK